MLRLYKRGQRLKKKLVYKVCSRLYIDANPNVDNSVMIAGTGRSGTTWLGDIIASQLPARTMFEPFHSRLVSAFKSFEYHQYMRPSDSNTALADYCKAVLSGRIRDRWIDSQIDRLLPVYRVIKEIRANLFLNWFSLRFPSTPILYIIRHPCAVVLSHLQVSWEVDEDIASFLAQDRLVADFLSDKLELIRAAKTFEEKVAVVWCVTNLVPLSQFQGVQLNVFFYEHLCTQIEEEIPRIFQAIRHVYRPSVFRSAALPSVTSRLFSPIMTGGSKIDGWQKALHAEQIRRVMAIVDAFGLSHYYDETPMPRANAWVTPPVQPSVACNA